MGHLALVLKRRKKKTQSCKIKKKRQSKQINLPVLLISKACEMSIYASYCSAVLNEMFHPLILLTVSEVNCTVRSQFSLPRLCLCFIIFFSLQVGQPEYLFLVLCSWLFSVAYSGVLCSLIICYGHARKWGFSILAAWGNSKVPPLLDVDPAKAEGSVIRYLWSVALQLFLNLCKGYLKVGCKNWAVKPGRMKDKERKGTYNVIYMKSHPKFLPRAQTEHVRHLKIFASSFSLSLCSFLSWPEPAAEVLGGKKIK